MYAIAVRSLNAASSSEGLFTSMILTPSIRIAWSYTLREYSGMITSFLRPVRSGSRCMRSGFVPAIEAAVQWVKAAQQPAVIMPHSAPVSSARHY